MPHHFCNLKILLKNKKWHDIIRMMWHYFIGYTKHMWQAYVVFNEKYGLRGSWCKWNITSVDKIQILKH